MSSINRATLPQEFLDSVSEGLMLPTPLPQFWFARTALGSQINSNAVAMGMPSGNQYAAQIMSGAGGVMGRDLDAMIRAADAYPDAVMTADSQFGLHAGDTVKMRRRIFTGGGYDLASRTVTPDVATSTTGLTIGMEDVAMVLKELEGPYGASGSAPQPFVMRDFDLRWRHSRDNLVGEAKAALAYDYIKLLDTVIRDQFRQTSTITYADDVTDVSSFTATAGHGASLELVLKARQALSDREWSPFSNGRYICLVPTVFNVQMLNDVTWQRLSANHQGDKNQLFGYIGSVQDVDFFEVTTLKSYAAAASVPNDAQTVPTGATAYEALLFGPGCVGMGTAQMPTAFYADDTNYGKEAKVIWRSVQAFQTLDIRGCQRILFQNA